MHNYFIIMRVHVQPKQSADDLGSASSRSANCLIAAAAQIQSQTQTIIFMIQYTLIEQSVYVASYVPSLCHFIASSCLVSLSSYISLLIMTNYARVLIFCPHAQESSNMQISNLASWQYKKLKIQLPSQPLVACVFLSLAHNERSYNGKSN